MPKPKQLSAIPEETISKMISEVRGVRVMLDRDLARVYGVTTKAFNQAVKRNRARFPKDFMFRLTEEEAVQGSQTVTASKRNLRYRPYAFTEHGALQAANVLRSPRAVQMNTTCGDAVGSTVLVAW